MITEEQRQEYVTEFENILGSFPREGSDALLAYIRKSDFYTAPASTKFHGAFSGGLLMHSLNVYRCLAAKKTAPVWKEFLADIPDGSIAYAALLHDICKTYYYGTERRNRKNEAGQWEQYDAYTVDDRIPYGHGEKSVMILQEYVHLTGPEKYAVRWHMGAFDLPPESKYSMSAASEMYPLVLALQEADQEATHLMEKEERKKNDTQ